jgi:hypothetical protein
MPQALSCPPDLPRTHRNRRHTQPGLTNIEGSLAARHLSVDRVVPRNMAP